MIHDFADDLPPVWADGHQLQQVAVNLLTNAHHAMRASSPPRRLTVSTRYDPESQRVRLSIGDTGPGMSADVQTRLGLSLCRGIVESHDGTIGVESVPGQGATFVIELPRGMPSSAGESSPAAEVPFVRGKTILVVDDETDVAALLAEALAEDGHRVDTAPDGAAALAKIAGQPYDLIISDCGMPVLGGVEFYRELTRREPRLANRVIFVSGDTLNPQTVAFLASIDAPRLSKPFSLDHVQSFVRQFLWRDTGTEGTPGRRTP